MILFLASLGAEMYFRKKIAPTLMKKLRLTWVRFGLLATVASFTPFTGCARLQTRMMKTELQEVAKRWCLTIRASQVVPVYPLTEDLQPGDIFLVQTPIAGQVSEYTRRGYLPLDIHMFRLSPLDYKPFYADAYLKGDYATVPHTRPVPVTGGGSGSPADHRFGMAQLPAAAFPDYAFEAKKGVGVQLAVPISGVPVGLSFMGASSVQGSVKLTDAFTYGLDNTVVLTELYTWAARPEVQLMLAQTRQNSHDPLYLRVVSRVYLVGGVDVSLQAQGASSGGADVGAAKPINPMSLTKENAEDLKTVAESYKEAAAKFTEALNQSLPGGSVRFATANRNSVTMHENFERLLAIGYLGFDVRVDEFGNLSAPVATLDILENRSGADKRLFGSLSVKSQDVAERQVRELYRRVLKDPENSGPVFDSIRKQFNTFGDSVTIPADLPSYLADRNGLRKDGTIAAKVGAAKGFDRYAKYRAELNNSLDALSAELADPVLIADRKRLRDADAKLRRDFETSSHVALALNQYWNEALRH